MACADPGIFVRGSENSLDNVFILFYFLFFLVLNLFYSLQRGTDGVQWFNYRKKLYFSKDPTFSRGEGSNICKGSNFSRGF